MITALLSRGQYLEAHASTTRADIAAALQLAETVDEVDQAAHLSLALFGVAATFEAFTEHGRDWRPLHNEVIYARRRVRGFHGDVSDEQARRIDNELLDAGGARRRARAKADREPVLDRYGFRLPRR